MEKIARFGCFMFLVGIRDGYWINLFLFKWRGPTLPSAGHNQYFFLLCAVFDNP